MCSVRTVGRAKPGNVSALQQVQLQPGGGAGSAKFKGTMLMMNARARVPRCRCSSRPRRPAAPPAPMAPAGPASVGAQRPSGAGPGAPQNKLKGTMVGVAPPMPPVAGRPGTGAAPTAAQPQANYGAPPPNMAPAFAQPGFGQLAGVRNGAATARARSTPRASVRSAAAGNARLRHPSARAAPSAERVQ